MSKESKNNSGNDMKKLLKDQTEKLTEIFDDRIKTVTEQYNDINKKFEKIDRTLKSHTETLGLLYVDVHEMKSVVKDLPFQIVFLRDTKLDKKHFVDLDQRVRRLEKK